MLINQEEYADFNEHKLPGLYMLWRQQQAQPTQIALAEEYILRSYTDADDHNLRTLLETDGENMNQQEWQDYKDKVLPGGLFVIFHNESNALVATAGAVHNPDPGRYYFPFGGELGYLKVHPDHRGQGLGQVISACVVQRFLSAGYTCIRVGVQGWRHAAIKTYLKVGFVPFLHDASLSLRWQRVCEEVKWSYTPDEWPKDLSEREFDVSELENELQLLFDTNVK